jgi:hypothetical protein
MRLLLPFTSGNYTRYGTGNTSLQKEQKKLNHILQVFGQNTNTEVQTSLILPRN